MIDFTIRQELTGVERWVGGWRSNSIFFGTQCTLKGAALTASVSRSVVR